MKKNEPKLVGGSNNRVIPMYNEPKNSPFVSNEQKMINTERYFERTQNNPQLITDKQKYLDTNMGTVAKKPLVDLQVYEPDRPQQKKPAIEPALYAPIGVPHPYNMGNPYPYQYVPNYNIPLLKNYNINITGPSIDHGRVSTIFEDILPKAQFSNTPNTLGERLNILHFIRSVFIKQNDGEDIDINGKSDNSLLSYLKFMELNPYNTNHSSNNPYKGLPDDMLIYRSCYPIKYDKNTGSVQCAKNSVGMNIRIYRLTNTEYNIRHIKNVEYYDYDVWRELLYYEYVREKILKTHTCPNFVTMYAYYICEKSDIDFDKILRIKGRKRIEQTSNALPAAPALPSVDALPALIGGHKYKNVKKRIVPGATNINTQQDFAKLIHNKFATNNTTTCPKSTPPFVPCTKEKEKDNGNMYIGKAIVSLTEAPTYNLFSWASRTYKKNGNIQSMINTGFHKSNIWKSIILQLMISLYVLQIHNIAYNDFDVENNVYIKDISVHNNINKYWKYNIDGLNYYVPNYGYILLLDSNFGDLKDDTDLLMGSNKKYKIYSSKLFPNKNGSFNAATDIDNKCFETFVKTINPNIFTNYFTNIGGTKPSEDIIQLLSDIQNDIISTGNKDIGYYIATHMGSFLNNRIGTYLKDNEINNIKQGVSTKFTKGQLIGYLVEYDTYKFVSYIEDGTSGKTWVLYKNNPEDVNIIKVQVPTGNLFYYSDRNVVQSYKPGEVIFNEESLLETYVINKNN